jgi:hypothetical protein
VELGSEVTLNGTRRTIRVDSRRLVRALTAIASLLVVIHVFFVGVRSLTGHDHVYGLVRLFDLDREVNVPSFYSGALFFLDSLLLLLVARAAPSPGPRRVWSFLCLLFLFLAFDELYSVHERLTGPVREALHTSGLFYYAWVIVYLPAVALVGAVFAPVWWRLAEPARRRLTIAAGVYLLGAVVLEMVSGAYRGRSEIWTPVYGLLVAVEESLEMAGLILMARALLGLLDQEAGGPSVVFEGAEGATSSRR